MKPLTQKLFFALFGTTEMRNISLNLIEKILEKENLDGFQYREPDYFKEGNVYLFCDLGINKKFTSKCHKQNGYWWTNEGLQYKATSIPCYLVSQKNKKIMLNEL